MSPTCGCVRDHVPNPKVLHRHHIVPRAWGGQDDEPVFHEGGNIVVLCPTAHENVHRLLNAYVRRKGEPTWDFRQHYTYIERTWAKVAWDWWTEDSGPDAKPPYTSSAGPPPTNKVIDIAQTRPEGRLDS